jgi:SAM-dependent methyltransferase
MSEKTRITLPPELAFGREGITARLDPVSRKFGFDRGQPICRYYIERFLGRCTGDITGLVLEFGSDDYARQFGTDVDRCDILVASHSQNPNHIVADITVENDLPSNAYDCIIATQVLCCTFEVAAAVQCLHRILKPGGVLLATFPGLAQVSRFDYDRWGDFWRFNDMSARRLLSRHFDDTQVAIEHHGNVQVAMAYLQGLASHELEASALDHVDPDYQVLIEARAVKTRS